MYVPCRIKRWLSTDTAPLDSYFRGLGRWCSTLFYSDLAHRTRVVAAYNVGRQSPKGLKTIYQQQVRHIQTHRLNTSPSRLFLTDFLAQLQEWQRHGDRLLIFIDMNEHVLRGTVARYLPSMGLVLGNRRTTHVHRRSGPNRWGLAHS
jgi:hypothetical protein